MIRLLIIDDHAMLLDGMSLALEREEDIQTVGTARSMQEGLELFRTLEPDVVVLDYRIGNDSGVELARALRTENDSIPLVGMSAMSSDAVIEDMVSAGCCSFVNKQRGIVALAQTIRDAHDGVGHLPNRSASSRAINERLSQRELEVLQLMSEGRTPTDIAQLLHLSIHTVRNHVREIRRKLDVSSQLAAVAVGLRTGLISGPKLD